MAIYPEPSRLRSALSLLGVGFIALAMAAWVNAWGGGLLALPASQSILLLALLNQPLLSLPKFKWGGGVWYGILFGLVIVSMVITIGWGWNEILTHLGYNEPEQPLISFLRNSNALEFAFIGIAAGFWGPILEEVYFRGWWQTLLKQKISANWAIALVALAFALLHGSLTVFLGLFIAGVCFGLAAELWGVSAAIAAHIVFNLVTIFAAKGGWL